MKNKFDQLVRNILLEGKNEAIAKWGNTDDVIETVEKFFNKKNGIRLKVGEPYNNIDWWHSEKTYKEFKQFVQNFESTRQLKTIKKYNITVTDDGNGKLIDTIKNYQIWFVNSYDSAKQLGRFYKGFSTKWCISTSNGEYYWNNDHKNDTFYFLIRKNPIGDQFDKLAFEYKKDGTIKIWDIKNRKNTFIDQDVINYMKNNYKWIDKISDSERYFLTPNLKIEVIKDNMVNVYGDIYLDDMNLTELPWKDKYIVQNLYGNLNLNYNHLKTFKNFPKYIHGDLNIVKNQFENFDGFPDCVEGDLDYNENQLKLNENVRERVKGIVME